MLDKLMLIQEIRWLHGVLRFMEHWRVETKHPEGDVFEELAIRVRTSATAKIKSASWWMLYFKYLKWIKSNPIVFPDRGWFDNFLDDLAFDYARRSLTGLEQDILETTFRVRVVFRQ